jgi:large subunit ribosomal protein L4
MIKLALRSALSDRAADGKVVVIDSWSFETPRTKDALAALAALDLTGSVLVVLEPGQDSAWKSFRNLPNVRLILARELNTYDVLCSDWIVFTEDSLPTSSPSTDAGPEDMATGITDEEAAETPVEIAGSNEEDSEEE